MSADIQRQTTIYTQVHTCGQFRGAFTSIQLIVAGGSWCAQDRPSENLHAWQKSYPLPHPDGLVHGHISDCNIALQQEGPGVNLQF